VPTDAPFTSEAWPPAAKNRAALIARLDVGIGRLREQLQKLRLTSDVAIFFTSAVAPEKFANPNLAKVFHSDENTTGGEKSSEVGLPMIANWPAQFPAGTVSRISWSAQDVAPTALEIGLQKPAKNSTGRSVLPMLLSQKSATPNP